LHNRSTFESREQFHESASIRFAFRGGESRVGGHHGARPLSCGRDAPPSFGRLDESDAPPASRMSPSDNWLP
jgi:hypothetical protein